MVQPDNMGKNGKKKSLIDTEWARGQTAALVLKHEIRSWKTSGEEKERRNLFMTTTAVLNAHDNEHSRQLIGFNYYTQFSPF